MMGEAISGGVWGRGGEQRGSYNMRGCLGIFGESGGGGSYNRRVYIYISEDV